MCQMKDNEGLAGIFSQNLLLSLLNLYLKQVIDTKIDFPGARRNSVSYLTKKPRSSWNSIINRPNKGRVKKNPIPGM